MLVRLYVALLGVGAVGVSPKRFGYGNAVVGLPL